MGMHGVNGVNNRYARCRSGDVIGICLISVGRVCAVSVGRVALSKLFKREGRAWAEGAILPYVGHLQLISTLKIGADQGVCQYKLTKPNLT